MKTATFLFFACSLVNVSLQCETPTYVAVIETVEAIPGGAFVKLRPNATTEWVNCLLSEYENKLAKDPRDTSEDDLDAVKIGDLHMYGGRGSGRFVDLNLTNMIVSGLSRPQIVSAEAEGLNREMIGQIWASIRYNGLRFKASFHTAYHDTNSSPAGLENCFGRLMIRTGEISFEIKIDGRSIAEKGPPLIDSMTMRLLSKLEELTLTYKIQESDKECGYSRSIVEIMAGSFVEDGPASLRERLRIRLEDKLKRNLRLALKAGQ